MGNGCTIHSGDINADRNAAQSAWTKAQEFFHSEELDLLILDEILYAITLDLVSCAQVVEALKVRNPNLHVILTGRNAPVELLEIADLVTEMRMVKHPFQKGEKGQLGLDF
jgi:cob(I)alamin adenosyltransferase